jgi:multiple sugar transport system substrate-binding protein
MDDVQRHSPQMHFGRFLLVFIAASGCAASPDDRVVIDFWAMGAEGEKALPLVDQFQAAHPDIRVRVQQVPWSAAHEKLLTAFAGDTLPDVCQLGNTWIAEFAALGSLEDLTEPIAASETIERHDYFPGVWQTNVVGGRIVGLPWYVDTRLLFYRTDLLKAAGHDQPPATWDEWLATMRDVQARQPEGRYAVLLPVNEFETPVILGYQCGADMLKDGARYGNFSGERFRKAFQFYVDVFREGLAPKVSNTRISNVWEEFERGTFAMYVSGPWNIAEFRRRMPADMEDKWATAPWPSRDGGGPGASNAGGSSLVIFKGSPQEEAACKFVEFLSQPAQQVRFVECTGNLPPGEKAWKDSGLLKDAKFVAFHDQLKNVIPAPHAPEWEQIVTGELVKTAEAVINGGVDMDAALAALDRKVDEILGKRRWMLAQRGEAPAP